MTERYDRAIGSNSGTAPAKAHPLAFSASEWRRLTALYGVVAALHFTGWGLFLHYSSRYPPMVGLGLAAYLFGLRHAFDADHIAAVDDTVRFLLEKGQRPLGVGFFFSLGHSTIVFAMAMAAALAIAGLTEHLPGMQQVGAVIGAGVSGIFLWIIGLLNLAVLLDLLTAWRAASTGRQGHTHVEELLMRRGFINRLSGGRLTKAINHSWQMYPVGLLFGLGFDTASEIALLAMTAGAAVGHLPPAAVLSLPILFASGMSVMDTTDGVLMSKVYNWAFLNPLRKIFYNLTTTGLSIAVALIIGTIELLQVLKGAFDLKGPFFRFIGSLDFGAIGYIIVGVFLMAWGTSLALWRFGHIEERYGQVRFLPGEHVHTSGIRHSHKHL